MQLKLAVSSAGGFSGIATGINVGRVFVSTETVAERLLVAFAG